MSLMKPFKLFLIVLISAALGAFGWSVLYPMLLSKIKSEETAPTPELLVPNQDQEKTEVQSDINDNESEDLSTYEDGTLNRGPYTVIGTAAYPASGQVEIIQTPEENLLHFINYSGSKGPNLHVYLSTDLEATDFIDLGEQKTGEESIIYGLPLDIDLGGYKYVLTWSESLGILFDYAKIN